MAALPFVLFILFFVPQSIWKDEDGQFAVLDRVTFCSSY